MRRDFWEWVDRRGPDECWLWTGGRAGRYGATFVYTNGQPRRRINAHRMAYILTYGDPGELTVDHTCNVPLCCNPAHLRPLSRGDNAARTRRERTHCAKCGTPWDDANTRWTKQGWRDCRECNRRSSLRYYTPSERTDALAERGRKGAAGRWRS